MIQKINNNSQNTHFMEGDTDMFEIPADSWNGAMEVK